MHKHTSFRAEGLPPETMSNRSTGNKNRRLVDKVLATIHTERLV